MSATTSFSVATESQLNAALTAIDIGGADAAVNAAYTITFAAGFTGTLATELMAVNLAAGASLTIDGAGATLNGGGAERGLFVAAGTVLVENLTLSNMVAIGGAGGSGQSGGGGGGAGLGGGLFVAAGADVTLNAVTFANDVAVGGAGGARTSASANYGFGGGGGLGGAGGTGGAVSTYGGGGGIGLTATGSAQGSGANGGAGIVLGAGNAGNGSGIELNSNGGAAGGGGGGGSRQGGGGGGGIGGGAGQVAGAAGMGGLGGFGGGGGFYVGGAGGFGGGGGAGYYTGGAGGFGGGGGGFLGGGNGLFAIGGGAGGFGGGNGGAGTPVSGADSGGGLGAGGAIFVQQGGTVVIQGGAESGGSVAGGATGGSTGTAGSAFGAGIFLQGNETLTLAPLAGQTLAIADAIADQTGSGGTGGNAGAGRVVIHGAGSVILSAANSFTGGIDLAGGTLVLANATAAGSGSIAFTGAATLDIGTSIPSNPITGFAVGDAVDFTAIAPAALAVTNNGTVTMIGGVTFSGVYSINSATPSSRLVLSSDGGGGTRVTVACFAAGTRILTPSGEVAVETLRPGQNVATRHGLRPVRWVGRRRIDLTRHSCPELAMPIRVAAGAIAPGVPHRDLWLSGDHAVLADGALIPIRHLANGASIARDDWPAVTYFHVELDHHDIIYAEGLPAESYLDTGNRADFEGEAVLTLHPDMTAKTRANGCAPLLTDGPALTAMRALLLRQAEVLGWAPTRDPALRVLADGRQIQPASNAYLIPPGTSWLRLLSRSVVPQERDASIEDRRRLGVAVAELCFDGLAAPDEAFGPGFYAAEPDWRWTNGDGWLSVPAGARSMSLSLVPIEIYRAHPDIDARHPGLRALFDNGLKQR